MELFSLFDFIFPLGDPVLAQMYGFNKVDTWILWVIAAAVYVVVCAFKGVGLYAMAKKRGNSALLCLLGFVPFASTYLMGRLAGELRLGNTKVKHIGLFAMLAELILCIGYAVQDIPQSVIFMNPDLYEVRPVASGNLTYLTIFFAVSGSFCSSFSACRFSAHTLPRVISGWSYCARLSLSLQGS